MPIELASVAVAQDGDYMVMVLRAPSLSRLLLMEIGPLEGRAIYLGAEGIKAQRPLTHDLIMNVLNATGYRLERVEIRELRNKTYFAALILNKGGQVVEVDSRPSDAVALALISKVPIMASDALMLEAGIEESEEPKPLH